MSTSPTLLRDNDDIPVPCVWVPNIGWVPKQGISNSTDANNNPFAAEVVSLAVGSAQAPYTSNPTQTSASGADTLFKWGSTGTTVINHIVIQNNTAITIYYAFDQVTTTAGNAVYTLASGQIIEWDRQCSVLHLSSSSSQPFGGTAGITIEGFI